MKMMYLQQRMKTVVNGLFDTESKISALSLPSRVTPSLWVYFSCSFLPQRETSCVLYTLWYCDNLKRKTVQTKYMNKQIVITIVFHAEDCRTLFQLAPRAQPAGRMRREKNPLRSSSQSYNTHYIHQRLFCNLSRLYLEKTSY